VEKHIQQIMKELPSESLLRGLLLQGARGNGVHYAWMDELSKHGIKRVVVGVDTTLGAIGTSTRVGGKA
jgi:ethanolamine utilization microcompartment shell protein EutL